MPPRRPNQFTQDKFLYQTLAVAAVAATESLYLGTADGAYNIEKFEIEIPGGYTASDTNYYAITLQAGATVLATLSLKTTSGGGFGNVTDGVFATATLAAIHTGSRGDTLSVVLTKNASAVNLPAGTVFVVHGRQL